MQDFVHQPYSDLRKVLSGLRACEFRLYRLRLQNFPGGFESLLKGLCSYARIVHVFRMR